MGRIKNPPYCIILRRTNPDKLRVHGELRSAPGVEQSAAIEAITQKFTRRGGSMRSPDTRRSVSDTHDRKLTKGRISAVSTPVLAIKESFSGLFEVYNV